VNFKDALSVHGIEHALISVRALASKGVVTTFNAEGGAIVVNKDHCLHFGPDHQVKCVVHKTDAQPTVHKALNANASVESSTLYCARFNYAGRKLVDHTISQLDAVDTAPQTFLESDVARMKALPFKGTPGFGPKFRVSNFGPRNST
jgi:hypothetical protein